jgi:hypothetical protein
MKNKISMSLAREDIRLKGAFAIGHNGNVFYMERLAPYYNMKGIYPAHVDKAKRNFPTLTKLEWEHIGLDTLIQDVILDRGYRVLKITGKIIT